MVTFVENESNFFSEPFCNYLILREKKVVNILFVENVIKTALFCRKSYKKWDIFCKIAIFVPRNYLKMRCLKTTLNLYNI